MESKKYKTLVNKTKKKQTRDLENKLVVTSGDREGGRGNIGVEDLKKKFIIGLYEIMCVKF